MSACEMVRREKGSMESALEFPHAWASDAVAGAL